MKIAIGFILALCTKAGDAMYSKSTVRRVQTSFGCNNTQPVLNLLFFSLTTLFQKTAKTTPKPTMSPTLSPTYNSTDYPSTSPSTTDPTVSPTISTDYPSTSPSTTDPTVSPTSTRPPV
jgi:hypothetical protein